jgi:hypothetical protein
MPLIMRFISTCCNLHAVRHDVGRISCQDSPDGYCVSCCLAAQKDSQLTNGFVYIDQFPARRTFLEKQANPSDDFGCPCYVFHNPQHSLACLFQIGVIALEPPQAGFAIDERGGNRLIDLVGKRSGQLLLIVVVVLSSCCSG